ncbi:VLRF1 family aeRF1-type release factor [Rhizohabitans arisaemae]|uniref:VLRF1 family aeRF1-type release factor n=1 Tax=Rhizohabitans arisaemae TaxID=2720610 RepID=UPI0024B24E6A|nr:VLRF1 family aeRF1-type release factor [Rhizohabitans arisaemae]
MSVILNQTTVRDLAALTDDLGVLSVYVTTDPREAGTTRPAWGLRIAHELAALRERVAADGYRDHKSTVLSRLDALKPEIDRLVDASEPGLGRALFATIGRDELRTLTLQMPLGDLAVIEPTAYVRPLVAATTAGAPAGVAAVSRAGVRLVDQRFGLARDVETIAFDLDTDDWRRKQGPRADNPGLGQRSASQRDGFDRRVDENTLRFLASLGPRIDRRAEELEWEMLVVTGDPRLVEAVVAGLPQNGHREIVRLSQVVETLPAPRLAEAVAPEMESVRLTQARDFAVAVRDVALAGGPGTVGLGDTLGALQQGRVAHLLLDEAMEWAGSRAPDGRLSPRGEVPPGAAAAELIPESRLGERMIELALGESAQVTMLEEPAAEPIAGHDGVAALLRW